MRVLPSVRIQPRSWFHHHDLRRYGRTMLFDIMVLIACVIPGIILSQQQLHEPWNAFRVARAQLSTDQAHIADYTTNAGAYRPEHLGSDLIHTALIQATDWPLDSLVVVPIGALLLALGYYGVVLFLTSSRRWAAGIALFTSWYYPGIYNQFSTQTYVWVYCLLLGFLIVFYQWLTHPKRVYEILLTAIFLATFLHYHTTPLWMIGLIVIGVGGSKLAQRTTASPYRYSWLLPVSWIAWDLAVDTVLHHGWQHLQTISFTTIRQSFVSKVLGPLLQRTPAGLDPFMVAPVNPPIATGSTLICLLLLTVPVGWWMIGQITFMRKTRQIQALVATPQAIFVWAIGGIALAHTTMYLLYGALSLRVIPVLFPCIVPLVWREQPWARWRGPMLVLLVASAMVGFFHFAPTIQPDMTAQQTGRASGLIATESTVLSDANLYGSLALQRATNHTMINLAWIDASNYRAVAEGHPLPQAIDYIAIAKTTKPLITTQWQYFISWILTNPLIEQHPGTNQIYASSRLSLLQPIDRALPTVVPQVMALEAPSSWIGHAFRLFGTMLALFVIPGLAIVWLAQRKQMFGPNLDIRVILACTIAFSIVHLTGISYLVQLTGIGIEWISGLTLLVPIVGLVLVRLRGQSFTIAPRWWRYGISVLVVIIAWIGFATNNVMAQTTSLPPLEAFTTQARAGAITIHLANNTTAPMQATVVIETHDGTTLMTSTQQLLPSTVTPLTWEIPVTADDHAIVIRVMTDQQPPLSLWFAHIPRGN